MEILASLQLMEEISKNRVICPVFCELNLSKKGMHGEKWFQGLRLNFYADWWFFTIRDSPLPNYFISEYASMADERQEMPMESEEKVEKEEEEAEEDSDSSDDSGDEDVNAPRIAELETQVQKPACMLSDIKGFGEI